MDFWSDHSVMFVIGLVACPRVMLLYHGLIPAMSVPPIIGLLLVPRMLIASAIAAQYGHTNSVLVVVCWILAIVLDLIGLGLKFVMQGVMMKAQMEAFRSRF